MAAIHVLIVSSLLAASPEGAPAPADLAAYEMARAGAGRDPEAHVRLALWCETHGMEAERLKHLAMAVVIDPKHATARGLLGLTNYRGRWQQPEAVGATVRADADLSAALAEYNGRRAGMPETADAHWKLALWCDEKGLKAEATAHLASVVRLDPSRDGAWKRLGYKKVGGRWGTDEQLAAAREDAEAEKRGFKQWQPLLTRYRGWLGSNARRDEAEQALAEVTDPRAVAAVLSVFGKENARLQADAVRILGQIDAPASARALALLAAWGRSGHVRRTAAETVRRRDPREYAGFLLSLLRQPLRYETDIVLGPDGNYHRSVRIEGDKSFTDIYFGRPIGAPGKPLGYPRLPDRLFADGMPFNPLGFPSFGMLPTQDSQNLLGAMVADPRNAAQTLAQHQAKAGAAGPGRAAPMAPANHAGLLIRNANLAAQARDAQILQALSRPPEESPNFLATVAKLDSNNLQIRQDNTRIFTALNTITDQDLPEDVEPWKEWWYRVQGYSYVRPETVEQPEVKPIFFTSMPSCFAAGTPVRTIDGPRPIEEVRVGDQVLAQDTTTGALSFRAVHAVHHNPPGETLKVMVGDELIVPSIFHRFWKAGEGWVMARDLKAGDMLRMLDGLARVESVEQGGVQPVFNLDVAENHDFFVGARGALVHDNTLPGLRLAPFDAAGLAGAPGVGSGQPRLDDPVSDASRRTRSDIAR